MCQSCRDNKPHAEAIAASPASSIMTTIMFLFDALVGAVIRDSPELMIIKMLDEEKADRELQGRVMSLMTRASYAFTAKPPHPGFPGVLALWAMSYIIGQAVGDDEGRSPAEWFDAEIQPELDHLSSEGEILDAFYVMRDQLRQEFEAQVAHQINDDDFLDMLGIVMPEDDQPEQLH